jgi:hypothetical protein
VAGVGGKNNFVRVNVLVACGVGEGEGEVRYRSELAAEGEDDAELISFLFWFLINI